MDVGGNHFLIKCEEMIGATHIANNNSFSID